MNRPPSAGMPSLFDAAAAGYDATFEDHPVTRNIRSVIQQTLVEQFQPGSRVLELNCGTGTDAIALAERGVRVTGVDSSAGMIARARVKIADRRLGHLVTLSELDFEDIGSLAGTEYDGAYSIFGGLNCSPRLRSVVAALARLVRPGSTFVACLLNRTCIWEIASFTARGDPGRAFRRMKTGGVNVPLGGASQHVFYYSPGEMRRILSPWFEVRKIFGLSIFSPSPNSKKFVSNHPAMTERLMRLDGRIRSAFPFRSLGDHFVVVAPRTPA